jgi:predicted TIM-barrel fold metal-dependent hydrolase
MRPLPGQVPAIDDPPATVMGLNFTDSPRSAGLQRSHLGRRLRVAAADEDIGRRPQWQRRLHPYHAHAAELPALQALAVPVVFGHFGCLSIGQGAQSPGFKALLELLGSGRAWVKLTGPCRLTRAPLPCAECDALAQALVAAAPQRLVWGSDWPHVMLRGAMPNDADLVDLVARWLPQEKLRRQALVDNPAALYGFGA